MTVLLVVLLVLAAAYVLSLSGRRGHPGLQALRGWRYAHRGLHDQDCPENSMAAFQKALEGGYGIELDVHLLKDGTLAVMHDSSLKRTTGADGCMEDLTAEDLSKYRLGGTEETIPAFSQVLELFDGKAPMIVELKTAGNNYAALTEAACKLLEGYKGVYCLESFDPRCLLWLKKNRPELIRGQLAENFLKAANGKASLPLRWVMTTQAANFLTRPDFMAYKYLDRRNPGCFLSRRLWGMQGVTWTIQSKEQLETAEKEGWIPIFENFIP